MLLDRTRRFKPDTSDQDILNAIRKNASNDYQRRIPNATKSNIRETLEALTDNRPYWNEFVDALVNRIGLEIYRNIQWNNPLAMFKIGLMEFGDTIEEIMVGLLEAKIYDPSREYLERDLFGTERPEVQTSFHKVNRKNWYKITINEQMLKQAFVTTNGLSNFIQQAMLAPQTSDNWDEYLLMRSLLPLYEDMGGFFNVNIPSISTITSDAAAARFALRQLRAYAGKLQFLSRHYNAAGMPAFASPDDLIILITPEGNAALDVEALAGAFNIDKMQMAGRIVIVDDLGIPGTDIIMTTKDFFVVADNVLRTESQWNPVALHTNYFLHHWQVISASRFVPAVRFSIDPTTPIEPDEPVVVQSVVDPKTVNHDFATVTEVVRGQSYGVDSLAITIPPEAGQCVFTVDGAHSERTYITQNGTLYVGADETATELVVTATSAALTDQMYSSAAINVVGDILLLWPNPQVVTPPDPDPGDDEEG